MTSEVFAVEGDQAADLEGITQNKLPAGATAEVTLGPWTAANGSYTVRTVIAADANELDDHLVEL